MSSSRNVIGAASLLLTTVALSAPAQSASCGQLWYARNSIYAAAGYCFETPEAIGAFGPRCYAPYGRLTRRQQARVNAIKAKERRQGC